MPQISTNLNLKMTKLSYASMVQIHDNNFC